MNAMEEAICPQCRKSAYFYTREEISRQIEAILREAKDAPYANHRTFLEVTLRAFARLLRHCVACDLALERFR
jgi:hypothetical protein